MNVLYPTLDLTKKAFVFELDDVLYPQNDYLLQVYFLFASLVEYTDLGVNASEVTSYMKKCLLEDGAEKVFERTANKFNLDDKLRDSFNNMLVNSKMPLKLLLYREALGLLSYLIGEGKSVFILTKGNPLMQLNKVKQLDWKGLEAFIKVYYQDELVLKSSKNPMDFLLDENQLTSNQVLGISPEGTGNYWKSIYEDLQVVESSFLK